MKKSSLTARVSGNLSPKTPCINVLYADVTAQCINALSGVSGDKFTSAIDLTINKYAHTHSVHICVCVCVCVKDRDSEVH